ncbi:Sfi1 spindle body protein-domain-containing protein [Crepidotus variabilis]|uniref:Sfi1 spindle body protein-domain-containing protein n=1 Tax=Crepidotus variabilis TaxID=179855 RepID=A0A9P6ENB8_9AGAR|nr:Sfi1 spindle body protein-domain-containing protein [Crepidotus variabilis]
MLPTHSHRASSLAMSTISNVTSGNDNSTAAPLELQNLTPHDVDIIDAVIERAGPAANTFFTIFKAYSDVLRERGLDPQEVLYYGKLLKLGTLKGKNWGDKWDSVKTPRDSFCPPPPTDITSQSESEAPPSFHPFRAERGLPSEKPDRIAVGRPKAAPRIHPPPQTPVSSISRAGPFDDHASFLSSTVVHKGKTRLVLSSTPSENGEMFSPVPPSYKSTAAGIVKPLSSVPSGQDRASRVESLFAGKKIITAPKERVKPAIVLDDAWKNIKMEQDEKVADEFRDSMLLARCWEIWRQGLLWIVTTHKQIQEARDQMVLRLHFQQWKSRIAADKAREHAQVVAFTSRHIKRMFQAWQTKLKQRKQAAWRHEMRQKMKLIKTKADTRIRREAWTKWQNTLLLRRAHHHYEIGLLFRFHNRWREKLIQISLMDQKADLFSQNASLKIVDRSWDRWRSIAVLCHRETILAQKVNNRIVETAFNLWRKHMTLTNAADALESKLVLRRTLLRWKTSLTSLKNLEHKAQRYSARQDDSLKRAIIRIWRARMRGAKLERFREITITKSVWRKWKYRQAKEDAQLDVAQTFFKRGNIRLTTNILQRWRQVQTTHRNAAAYAVKYDEAHVQARVILAWRMRLHGNLQSLKVARWAHRYFATRRAWQLWLQALDEQKKQQKLRAFESSKVRIFFLAWRQRVVRVSHLRQCEIFVQDRVEKRILQAVLLHWTQRVIEIKSRELDVAQRADTALERAALMKWRSSRQRHLDELSLLENYLLVKREDSLRRAFQRWLTAKRASEHRRLTHQKKEAQLRQVLIVSAWDKWREKFREERLRPLEYQIILDNQRYILRRAFNVWLSKADSLPAIRFHSQHLKEKVLKRWKVVMPNALKAKRAREMDRHNTLVRFFMQWQQAHKTKTTLKAVARAKYLRLPASTTRQPLVSSVSRARYTPASALPRRRSSSPEDEPTTAGESEKVSTRRSFLRTPLISKPRSERSVPRSELTRLLTRNTSPVRSVTSVPTRRSPSPISRRGPASESIADTAVGSDRLWDALRRAGQTRRPRNF